MADNFKIGAGLALDGEREFKRAISTINKDLSVLGSEMQKVSAQFSNSADSMEALTSKQQVYNRQIEEQKKKIETLRQALANSAKEFGENDTKTKNWQISLNKAEAELAKTENALNETVREMDALGDESENAAKSLDTASKAADDSGNRFEKLGGILKASALALGAVAAAAGAAAIKLGKEVVQQFGELEQNLGGSEAVFGEYAENIQKTGEEAYKNLGVSQSDYLATANKMGALFQGVGIEQKESLELTEKAMQRAADMASVMGIDMSSAMEAVTGAAKGNYTMMDNLGVKMDDTSIKAFAMANGFKGAWSEITGAEKAQYAMEMFFESTEQYAGNFAKEATKTITGSLGLLGAATDSFIAGLGNKNADMSKLTGNMVDAFQSVVQNITPIIKNLTAALPAVVAALIPAIGEILPDLVTTVTTLFEQVLTALLSMLPELIPVAVEAIMTITNAIIDNLPLIVNAAISLITTLADGLIRALPELIPAAVSAIITVVDSLIDNIDMMVDAAIAITIALAEGLITALPILLEKAPEIIGKLNLATIRALPKLLDAALKVIGMLVIGIVESLPKLVAPAIKIVDTIVGAIVGVFDKIKDIGVNIVTGVWEGIKSKAAWLKDNMTAFFKNIVDNIKNVLGIASPSKVTKEMGGFFAEGFGVGFDRKFASVKNKIESQLSFTGTAGAAQVNGGLAMASASNTTNNFNMPINAATIQTLADFMRMFEGARMAGRA